MKKSLSLILALAMVFTMFAGIAFADENATLDTQAKYDALKAKGIFEGTDGGAAALDQSMTRAQFAKTLSVLNGLTEDVASSSVYKDLVGAGWAAGFIGAVTKAKYMDGVEEGKFFPSDNVTLEQEATVLVRVFNLPLVTDAVSGKVANWAKSYVATAIKFGLLTTKSDYTVAAKRADLVDSAYVAYNVKQVTVKSVKVVDSKNIEVTFSDNAVEKVALTTALDSGKETVLAVTHNGFTYAVKVKFDNGAVSNIAATGAKKITVTFGSAVDTTKATFDVKKGVNPANVNTVTWSDDKKVATLELASYFTKGDYTVTVGGVVDPAYKQTLSVDDQRITKLEFPNDKAALDRNDSKIVYVTFKLTNQYGEDVTKDKYNKITWSIGKGTGIAKDSGKLQLTTVAGNEFKLDEKIAISGLYSEDQLSAPVFNNVVATVSAAAQVASIDAIKVAHTNDATKVLDVNSDPNEWVVVVNGKDQYGSPVDKDMLSQDLVVSVTNNLVAGFKTQVVNVNGSNITQPAFNKEEIQTVKDQLVLHLANGTNGSLTAGTTTLYMISKTTGAKATIDIKVGDKKKVDTFTLTAPDIAVNGEKTIIPFTALDVNGKAITNASDLTWGTINDALLSLSPAGPQNTALRFEQDYVKNTANLVLDTTNVASTDKDSTVYINAVTSTGKTTSLTITLKANAKASVITGVDGLTNVMVDGAATDFKYDKLKVLDQYGRTYDIKTDFDKKIDKYKVVLKISDISKVDFSTVKTPFDTDWQTTITSAATKATVLSKAKGSSTVSLKLYDNQAGKYVDNSDYSVSLRVVEPKDITGFDVADVAKLWAQDQTKVAQLANGLGDWNKGITVTGQLSDGTKNVGIANGDSRLYTVAAATYGITYTGGKLSANYANLVAQGLYTGTETATKEVTTTVKVTGFKNDGSIQPVDKTVTISNEVPAAAKLELKSNPVYDTTTPANSVIYTKESDGVVSVAGNKANFDLVKLAEATVKVTDQYGTELKSGKFKDVNGNQQITSFNLRDKDGAVRTITSGDALSNAQDGDSFIVTASAKNGQSISFKVIYKGIYKG